MEEKCSSGEGGENVFAFDKTAQAIAALHTKDMLRSICHEQIVEALRKVKNASRSQGFTAGYERAREDAAKVAQECIECHQRSRQGYKLGDPFEREQSAKQGAAEFILGAIRALTAVPSKKKI